MSGSVDAVLAYWSEQREQLRQSESQRAALTNYVLVVASAISGLIVQQKFTGGTLPLSVLIVGIGLYGAVSAAKYHKRAEYHLTQAQPVPSATHWTRWVPPHDARLLERREAHYRKYPLLQRIRVHWLWTGLRLAIAGYGIILAIVILSQ